MFWSNSKEQDVFVDDIRNFVVYHCANVSKQVTCCYDAPCSEYTITKISVTMKLNRL